MPEHDGVTTGELSRRIDNLERRLRSVIYRDTLEALLKGMQDDIDEARNDIKEIKQKKDDWKARYFIAAVSIFCAVLSIIVVVLKGATG